MRPLSLRTWLVVLIVTGLLAGAAFAGGYWLGREGWTQPTWPPWPAPVVRPTATPRPPGAGSSAPAEALAGTPGKGTAGYA